MKRGFTVLEMLVASLLLGMLMSILTMLFSQSSIAWRTGIAGIADMDDERSNIADVRYKADNAYVWKNKAYCVRSVFDEKGELREDGLLGNYENDKFSAVTSEIGSLTDPNGQQNISVSAGSSATKNYVVNVMSAGPDGKFDTYDDIWSLPDDPNEW